MKITIFGSGYVGLVTAACLAEVGNHIVCVDVDEPKIADLKQGKIPIYEPGLTDMIVSNARAGRIRFTTDAKSAVEFGEYQFIAVGTPPDEDGSADLRYVLEVARSIGQHMKSEKIVVDKSTVPVGTADMVAKTLGAELDRRGEQIDFHVVSNPEFLKEGAAIKDFMRPDRIVLGTSSEHGLQRMNALYAPFSRNHDKIVAMDVRSAELTKYAANAMLATKISFMNELANIAEHLGADIEQVRIGIGSDSRIGFSFIYPGAGYGGSCFPKDVQALTRTASDCGYRPAILNAVEAVNKTQKEVLFRKIMDYYGDDISGKTFALWGLAFKPNTDDMREAPSRVLIRQLHAAGAKVQAYDPQAGAEARRVFEHVAGAISIMDSAESALENADALIVITEWQCFRSPDFEMIKDKLASAVIFDGRNIYEPEFVEAAGLAYYGIGRGRSVAASGSSSI